MRLRLDMGAENRASMPSLVFPPSSVLVVVLYGRYLAPATLREWISL